jgi:hypothetical protein
MVLCAAPCAVAMQQRVRFLFRVNMLDKDYKVVDSSLVKEQELLQTSAVFLFSAGLVASFLSGAPHEVASIKAVSDWVSATTAYTNYTRTYGVPYTSTQAVWRDGITNASRFRSLWGTCMLLTLLAVICAYVSRTALFLCWSLIKMKVEGIRESATRKVKKRVSKGQTSAVDFSDHVQAAVQIAYAEETAGFVKENGEHKQKRYMKLAPLVTYIAVAVSASKVLFITSLVLWLVTIIWAIVTMYRLREDLHSNKHRSAGGILLVSIAGATSFFAVYAFVKLLVHSWTSFALWQPAVKRKAFVKACQEKGIFKALLAEPKAQLKLGTTFNTDELENAATLALGPSFVQTSSSCSRLQPSLGSVHASLNSASDDLEVGVDNSAR